MDKTDLFEYHPETSRVLFVSVSQNGRHCRPDISCWVIGYTLIAALSKQKQPACLSLGRAQSRLEIDCARPSARSRRFEINDSPNKTIRDSQPAHEALRCIDNANTDVRGSVKKKKQGRGKGFECEENKNRGTEKDALCE